MPLIELKNISKSYKDHPVLSNVNLAIEKGEFISLIGASGAGKSTLLKMMYAEEFPSEGQVFFGQRDIAEIKKHSLPFYRRNFGTVFQEAKLLEHKTVFENVAYALEVHGASDEQINTEVPRLLTIVGLEKQLDKYPHEISGGEAQRVALARALIHRPRVLIADEPTGNLDPDSTQEIVDLLLKINEFGTTVILATHDPSIVDQVKRRVLVMSDGRLVRDAEEASYTGT